MNRHPELASSSGLRIWQARQNADGLLASVLLFASAVPVICFVISAGPATAFVMVMFLVALAMACVRLLNSAAMVARIRASSIPCFAPEEIASEILDVYEKPAGLEIPATQSTNPLWLSNSIGISDGSLRQLRRQGRG